MVLQFNSEQSPPQSCLIITILKPPGDSWIISQDLCKTFIWGEMWMDVCSSSHHPHQAQEKEFRCMWIQLQCDFCSFPFQTSYLFFFFMVLSLPIFLFYLLQGRNGEHQSNTLLILSSIPGSSSLCQSTGVFGFEPRISSVGGASAGEALLLQCSEDKSCNCGFMPKMITISWLFISSKGLKGKALMN